MKANHSIVYPLAGGVLAGAILLFNTSAPAESLFVANFFTGNVYEITPDGTTSVFASGLPGADLVAVNGNGDLLHRRGCKHEPHDHDHHDRHP